MKLSLTALAALSTLAATEASAQYTDLTGRYRCVQLCRDGAPMPAFVTQNGRELNLVNEAGEPSRAWIDWVGHIWAENWQQGAIYSPDGMVIQFDRGTVWQRELPASCRSSAASAGARAVQARRFRAAGRARGAGARCLRRQLERRHQHPERQLRSAVPFRRADHRRQHRLRRWRRRQRPGPRWAQRRRLGQRVGGPAIRPPARVACRARPRRHMARTRSGRHLRRHLAGRVGAGRPPTIS